MRSNTARSPSCSFSSNVQGFEATSVYWEGELSREEFSAECFGSAGVRA